jgi:hypothetical protein
MAALKSEGRRQKAEVAERPLLMCGEMVRATLADIKLATRRLAMIRQCGILKPFPTVPELTSLAEVEAYCGKRARVPCRIGDQLWVKETFFDFSDYKSAPLFREMDSRVAYRADGTFIGCHKWSPSIHMPRWASRLLLEVTGVRVERLQDITGADVTAEGVTYPVRPSTTHPRMGSVLWNISSEFSPLNYIAESDRTNHEKILIAHYAALWDSLYAKRPKHPAPWESNPWVWVIEFKRVRAPDPDSKDTPPYVLPDRVGTVPGGTR